MANKSQVIGPRIKNTFPFAAQSAPGIEMLRGDPSPSLRDSYTEYRQQSNGNFVMYWRMKKPDGSTNHAAMIPQTYLHSFFKDFTPEQKKEYSELAPDKVPFNKDGIPLFDFRMIEKWRVSTDTPPLPAPKVSKTQSHPAPPVASMSDASVSTGSSFAETAARIMPENTIFNFNRPATIKNIITSKYSHKAPDSVAIPPPPKKETPVIEVSAKEESVKTEDIPTQPILESIVEPPVDNMDVDEAPKEERKKEKKSKKEKKAKKEKKRVIENPLHAYSKSNTLLPRIDTTLWHRLVLYCEAPVYVTHTNIKDFKTGDELKKVFGEEKLNILKCLIIRLFDVDGSADHSFGSFVTKFEPESGNREVTMYCHNPKMDNCIVAYKQQFFNSSLPTKEKIGEFKINMDDLFNDVFFDLTDKPELSEREYEQFKVVDDIETSPHHLFDDNIKFILSAFKHIFSVEAIIP